MKTYMLLTTEERIHIKRRRGEALTQQPAHTEKFSDPASRTYFWPWGQQPDEELKAQLASKDPIRAANKYLALFHPGGESKGWGNPPKRRHT